MLIQSQPAQSFCSNQAASHHPTALAGPGGQSMDLVTFTNVGSIPTSWSNQEDMMVTVYSFVKTFVG